MALVEEMKQHAQSLLELTNQLQMRLGRTTDNARPVKEVVASSPPGARIHAVEIQGTLILCRLMKTRLLFSLAPAQFCAMEMESQKLARQVLDLERHLGEHQDDWILGGLFMSQTIWIARATMETHGIWMRGLARDEPQADAPHGGMIAQWKFNAWCHAMGRRVGVSC